MRKLFTLLVAVLVSTWSHAQMTIGITDNGPITISCGFGVEFSHILNDDDPNAQYPPSSDYTLTICPDGLAGSKVKLDIIFGFEDNIWNVHSSDTLFVFDGTDTIAPLLGAYNSDTNPSGFSTEATLDNPTGCITIQFVSDEASEGNGFSGNVACYYPCQPFTPHITSIPEMSVPDTGYIDICLGDTVWFQASAVFPYSGTNGGIGYDQTNATSTFNWIISDGSEFNDMDSIAFIPSQQAGYFVDLQVTDEMNCVEIIRTKVRVSTLPSFVELATVLDDTICIDETAIILGGFDSDGNAIGFEPTEGAFITGGIFAGLTYLPDGNNDNYTTDIEITQFADGQVIESGTDVIDICVNIEHSYLGDLEMMLTCPNGNSIVIFNSYTGEGISPAFAGGFGGGNTFLGDPIDNNNTPGNPGEGWEYCFSYQATWGTLGQEFAAGNTMQSTITPGPSMSPGTYQPEQSFDDLLGCPINGTWTLTVRDNLNTDDGYIFEWGILFDPNINPNTEFYEPAVATAWWTPDPTIESFLADSAIEVLPPSAGDYFYTFNLEDTYGCFYDTTVSVHLVPPLTSFTQEDLICALDVDLSAADDLILGQWSFEGPAGATASFSPSNLDYEANVSVSDIGTYLFIFEAEQCGQLDSVEVSFLEPPVAVVLQDMTVCPGDDVSFDAANATPGITYTWNPGGESEQVFNLDSLVDNTSVTLSVENDCGTETATSEIIVNRMTFNWPSDACLDDVADIEVGNSLNGGEWTANDGPGGGVAAFAPNVNANAPEVSVDIEGVYTITYTDDFCDRDTSFEIQFVPIPEISITTDTTRLCLERTLLLVGHTNTELLDGDWFDWSPTNLADNDSLLISAATFGLDSTDRTFVDSTFTISIYAQNFCGNDMAEIEVQFINCQFDVPNIFNPSSADGDFAANGYFNLDLLALHPGNNVKIFDRWGRKRYDEDNYHLNPWNGEKASDGVYYYVVTFPDNEPKTGYVHLIDSN
ncbi:MAG: gliding motility-associated C-terminal domain-containing protein [Flavobacteriales bacterium]|nr:gliding motility-associated C-terminal domain-containing protein [Flavobacteriales bacterium]